MADANDDPCRECGRCCTRLIVEIEHVDVVREPRLLPVVQLLGGKGTVQYDSDWENEYRLACGSRHPCAMLGDQNRCLIYATRPNCCVMFEVGSEKCNELRDEAGLSAVGQLQNLVR